MRGRFFSILLFVSAAQILTAGAAQTCWNFPQAADQWNILRNMSVDRGDGELALFPTKADSSIAIAKTDFDPVQYNTLRICYRAEGFKVKRTSGSLYFGTAASPKINGKRSLSLPSLITDGSKQVMTVDLTGQKNSALWNNAGKITTLRLDIVDQYPGDVYISKIEFLDRRSDGKTLVWDFADGIGDWQNHEKLTMSWQDNSLFLQPIAIDSRIINKNCRFAGKLYKKMVITYRAEGFAQRTTGQLFFTSNINKKYAYKLRSNLPPLKCDGKVHDMVIKTPWGDENITSLRLDIVDQYPGKVWIKKIELLP